MTKKTQNPQKKIGFVKFPMLYALEWSFLTQTQNSHSAKILKIYEPFMLTVELRPQCYYDPDMIQ